MQKTPWARAAEQPRVEQSRSARLWARLAGTALAAAALASGLGFLAAAQTPHEVAAVTPAPPPPAWVDIVHPIEMFDLPAPELAKLERYYEARRHRLGGGRQDFLAFGNLAGPGPYLRLDLYRPGQEEVADAPFYVELARRAAEAGLSVLRSAPPEALTTRFGVFELSDLSLATGLAETGTACLGFRNSAANPELRMAGFFCPNGVSSEKALDAHMTLGCLIDRLDLNIAGEDRALAAFFAASEMRRRPACAGVRLEPNPARATWLEEPAKPAAKPVVKRR